MKTVTHVGFWISLAITGLLVLGTHNAQAAGCDDYPYGAGDVSYEETPRGPKILATGAAVVDFDDAGEVIASIDEATLEAKAAISKFFKETIHSDEVTGKGYLKTVKIVKGPGGEQKEASMERAKLTLKRLSNHSEKLLRGVIKLADCYTKGQKVMVSVGLKPETIAAAEDASRAIDESVNRQTTTTETTVEESTSADTDSTGTTSQQGGTTEGPESFSTGTEKLESF